MKLNPKIIQAGLSQGLPSLLTFISALWLLWQTSLAEFGLYSLLFAITRLMIAMQAPLISMPMNVLAKKRISIDHYADFFRFHSIMLLVSVLISGLIAVFFFPGLVISQTAFILFALSQMTREFIKSYYYSTHKIGSALRLEIYTTIIFLLTLAAGSLLAAPSINSIFLAGAAAGIVPGLHWIINANYLNSNRRRHFKWKRYLYIWKISRWSLAGAISNEIVARSYNYLVAIFGGYELLGLINFARQLFSPLQLLSNSWMQIGIPMMREHYANNNTQGINELRHSSQIILAVFTAVWTALLWALLPWIETIMPDGNLPLMMQLTLLWGIYYFVEFQLIIYRIEIQVLLWFRWLFLTELAIAGLTLALTPLVLKIWDPSQLIALGFILNFLLWSVYYRRFTKRKTDPFHTSSV